MKIIRRMMLRMIRNNNNNNNNNNFHSNMCFYMCSFKGENNRKRKWETPVAPSNVIWIVPCSRASAASPESIRASGTTWVSPSWSKISNEKKLLFWRSGSTKIMKVSDLKKHMQNCYNDFVFVPSLDHSGESLESVLLCSSHLCKLICAENVVSLQGPIKKDCMLTVPKLLWLGALISPFWYAEEAQQGRVRHTLQRSLSLLGLRSWIETNLPGSFQVSVIRGTTERRTFMKQVLPKFCRPPKFHLPKENFSWSITFLPH